MFSLGTANRAAAAARARDIYLHLAANGWETTLTKFKPKIAQAAVRMVTVGDLIREVRANCPKRGRRLTTTYGVSGISLPIYSRSIGEPRSTTTAQAGDRDG